MTLNLAKLNIRRGDDLSLSLTGLGDITLYSKIWFTVKPREGDYSDSDSVLQVYLTVGTGDVDGISYVESLTPTAVTNGSITVDDDVAGDITLAVKGVETAKLKPNNNLEYDVQMLDSAGAITTLGYGYCAVVSDVTRSTS